MVTKILYVCEECEDGCPEICGKAREDLRVMPDGRWLCEDCFDASILVTKIPRYSDLPMPPNYVPEPAQ